MAVARVERRLAAILAADVVGYSRLMGQDEAGTLARLRALRKELIEPRIAAYHGRIVKLMGDGALVEFASVVDAVECAVEIQHAVAERNREVSAEQRVEFRIGINLGDIIVEDADIYGDGVNVAARLEGLAAPGGICVSQTVRNHVLDKLPLAFEDLGEHQVKNIARPVHVYRVVIGDAPAQAADPARRRWRIALLGGFGALLLLAVVSGVAWRFYVQPILQEQALEQEAALPLPDKASLAVLPFTNLSGDPAQEYFSDGMTESLITDLSQISGLFVIARNTAFTYKGQAVNVTEVARDLGVRYVLEGSVQKAADRVRITAQLIDAATGFHLWADRFDRDLEDVFALQDEVAERIVTALEVRLTEGERRSLTRQYTQSVEAYDYYLRGREQQSTESDAGYANARVLFEQAVVLDPDFAPAYAQLAYTLARDISGVSGVRESDLAQALELAGRAVALDDSIPLVHFVMAYVQRQRRDPAQAMASLERALELDPNYADAYGFLSTLLSFAGRPDEGLEMIEKANRLNPASSYPYLQVEGLAYFALERYDDAIGPLREAIERNPSSVISRVYMAASYANAGRLADAEWEVSELLTLDPGLSVQDVREWVPFTHPEPLERMLDGLREAGLPERG